MKILFMILVSASLLPAMTLSVDSVTVDSVWNSDSGGVARRSCLVTFVPKGDAQYAWCAPSVSFNGGSTWFADSIVCVNKAIDTLLPCGKKKTITLRIKGGDRNDVAIRMTAKLLDSSGHYEVDFAKMQIEDPLSVGGLWSNNTQGVGGNAAPLNLTSMRVALASDGVTRIAMENHGGIEYDDSFAFIPGWGANQFLEAVIYKAAGYNPNASGSNHELEIILGCRTASGIHRWNEFLFNSGGGVDIVSLDGGPSAFTSIGVSAGAARIPVDGDVFRATKIGNALKFYQNGVLICSYTGPLAADGSGIGIGGFVRPDGSVHNKYGFRRLTLGNL
ncbi:MAG: hypothetical protein JF616_02420 [Fibrobacteres bacterium]|jgi:hypothetical protein|nr:hypothetical protein [Fibrobacterota bacterium]